MKRRHFIGTVSALLATSCARMEQRGARYDQDDCPFCTKHDGVCSYCHGTGSCSFCNGTGKRHTGAPNLPGQGVSKGSYEEDCPYCKTTGKCHYCSGTTKCWACDGAGTVENWDFYEKYRQMKATDSTSQS